MAYKEGNMGAAVAEAPEKQAELEENKKFLKMGETLKGSTDRISSSEHKGANRESLGIDIPKISKTPAEFIITKSDNGMVNVRVNIENPSDESWDSQTLWLSVDSKGKLTGRGDAKQRGSQPASWAINDEQVKKIMNQVMAQNEMIQSAKEARESRDRHPHKRDSKRTLASRVFDSYEAMASQIEKSSDYYVLNSRDLPSETPHLPKRDSWKPEEKMTTLATENAMVDISVQEFAGAGIADSLVMYFPRLAGGEVPDEDKKDKVNIFKDAVLMPFDTPDAQKKAQGVWKKAYEAMKFGLKKDSETGKLTVADRNEKLPGASGDDLRSFLLQQLYKEQGDKEISGVKIKPEDKLSGPYIKGEDLLQYRKG